MRRQNRVLVISPNFSFQETTAAALAGGQFAITCASERIQALQLMYRLRPSVILLQALPFTACDWMLISDIRALADTPILLLSDALGYEKLARCSQLGWVYPLRGTVSDGELVAQVTRLIDPPEGLLEASEPSEERMRRPDSPLPTLQYLEPHQVRQLEHALDQVGTRGEIRLVIRKGILRFLVKCRTEPISALVHSA